MKKNYRKPHISVEAFTMDQPIAANCTADFDDLQSLIALGCFGNSDAVVGPCAMIYEEAHWGMHDTVCYHSNIRNAFLS